MKKVLLFITMAAALLFTQCKKEVSVPSAGKTVSMTVTAGPGGKTDITENGAITWSTGDKLYVGDGEKYIGYLTLVGEGGSATGAFTGNVTLGEDVTGEKSFGFFYLGSNPPEVASSATFVDVEFDNQTGLLGDLGSCHVGYGSATGTVVDNVVTDINVMLVSKVALAHFSFTKNAVAYTGALTLSGDNICNKMTVNFASAGFDCTGTKGGISLAGGNGERYVMLVPTDETTGSQTLTLASADFEGSATFGSGIEANKFYGRESAIEVKHIEFTVDENGTKVKFAPGNLYYDGSAFHFEANQWDFRHYNGKTNDAAVIGGESTTTPAGTVGSFFWSKDAAKACAEGYDGTGAADTDVFFTKAEGFKVGNETSWRTLSKDEWDYLLNTRCDNGGSSLRAWVTLTDVGVSGLVILPDNSTTIASSVTTKDAIASSGAVFLPAAGQRYETNVDDVGSSGRYWSSTCFDSNNAFYMFFNEGTAFLYQDGRNHGCPVRLVR